MQLHGNLVFSCKYMTTLKGGPTSTVFKNNKLQSFFMFKGVNLVKEQYYCTLYSNVAVTIFDVNIPTNTSVHNKRT